MLNVVYMCALLAADLPCTPYRDMDSCRTAERGLAIELVESSTCTKVEALVESNGPAPILSPMPPKKPKGRSHG